MAGTDELAQILGATSGFKLGRGVVGKTGQVAIGLLSVWGLVIWRISDNLVADSILVGVGLVATFFVAWFVRSTQGFAEKNPALALLEGAELVAYKQLEMASAGLNPEEMKLIGQSQGALLPRKRSDDEK